MLRLRLPPTRRRPLLPFPIRRCSSSSHKPPLETTHTSPPRDLSPVPPPPHPSPLQTPSSLSILSPSSSSYARYSIIALSASLLAYLISSSSPNRRGDANDTNGPGHRSVIEGTLHRSNESLQRVYRHVIQTGAAASVLWQSLVSVLSSANQGVRAGFELRVAALLADIAAANSGRRAAIVGAGDGRVVDWLLDTVAAEGYVRGGCGAQAEAARALAYLVADEKVSEEVLGRPGAVGKLLRFIFSCQPQRSKKVILDKFLFYR